MPIVFIHGVNTRIDEAYLKHQRDRGNFIEEFLKPKLPKPYSEMKVVFPYWGDNGAQTGSGIVVPGYKGGGAEAMGVEGPAPRSEDRQSYEEIFDTLLGVLNSVEETTGETDGTAVGLIAKSLWNLKGDEKLRLDVDESRTQEEALNIIEEALHERLGAATPQRTATGAEDYGIKSGLARAGAALGGLFSHPYVKRPLSTAAASFRVELHKRFALFLSDVFVYLKERGNRDNPGPIIKKVLDAFNNDEPTLVVTHSMGGNIFYDVITHFAPKTRVAAWMSVGGQVAFFEYQRLFIASAKERFTGQKVAKPIDGPWLNVYDPIDPFGFLAEPVFDGVKDFEFVTGSNIKSAHSDYFIREDFYSRAGSRFKELLEQKAQ